MKRKVLAQIRKSAADIKLILSGTFMIQFGYKPRRSRSALRAARRRFKNLSSFARALPVSECDNLRYEGWSIREPGVQGIYPLPAGGILNQTL